MTTTRRVDGASLRFSAIGAAVTAMGLAHFVIPNRVVPYVAPAFPEDTRRHVLINGVLETLLGVGLTMARTRRAALLGILGYIGYVGFCALRHR